MRAVCLRCLADIAQRLEGASLDIEGNIDWPGKIRIYTNTNLFVCNGRIRAVNFVCRDGNYLWFSYLLARREARFECSRIFLGADLWRCQSVPDAIRDSMPKRRGDRPEPRKDCRTCVVRR